MGVNVVSSPEEKMESFPLIALLALVIFAGVIGFALMCGRRSDEKSDDLSAHKTRVTKDTPAE